MNLDGVVNDQIYPYMLDHRLVAYMDKINLNYVADYPNQINDANCGTIFGYSVQELTARLQPVYSIPKFESGDYWNDFTLYRLSSTGDRSSSQNNR